MGGYRMLDGAPPPRAIPPKVRNRPAPQALSAALESLRAAPRAKFDETVELCFNLSVDPRRGDQMVRGAAPLPHGTGKRVRVAVFARDAAAAAAREAGAEVVGAEDLVRAIEAGEAPAFDKTVAVPSMMPLLGKVARVLGPKGLMPNPKLGTVTEDVASAVQALRKGRVEFRADKTGIVHVGVGKLSFSNAQLVENAEALAGALLDARPKALKGGGVGGYVISAFLSSTMGPGVPVTLNSLFAGKM